MKKKHEIITFSLSSISLLISLIALFVVQKIDFATDSKKIVNAIEINTKTMKDILERNDIGIEITDPPLEKVNSWNNPIINSWFINSKKSCMDCGSLGKIGHLLGATVIVSNFPKNTNLEVYITKKDYTENEPGFWKTPETKDRISNMIMKSFDFVVCDKTPHQIIILVRDTISNVILKYESFTIK